MSPTTPKITSIPLAEHVAMHMFKHPSGSLDHGGAIKRAGYTRPMVTAWTAATATIATATSATVSIYKATERA